MAALDFAAESRAGVSPAPVDDSSDESVSGEMGRRDACPALQPPRPDGDDGEVLVVQTLGAETYHRTTMTTGGRDDTAFNLATVIDFTRHQHLLFSAGRSIDGPTDFQCYIAYQFTFGPEFFHSISNWFGH